jgi:hypothetical protein
MTLLAPAVADQIAVKGQAYGLAILPEGFELTKPNGSSYFVSLDGSTCECPDWSARHKGLPTKGCKHIQAIRSAGLLLAPVSGGSPAVATPPPAVVAPITLKDLARSSYFGIKLPAAPLAVEARINTPVPTLQSLPPAGWDAISGDDEDASHYGPAGDDWSNWTDDLDRWTVSEPATLAPYDDRVRGEAVALRITLAAIANPDSNDFYRLGADDLEAFWGFALAFGEPVATWPSWLAMCRAGSPVSFPDPVKPTWRPRTEPTPAMKAEAAALLNAETPDYFVIAPRKAPSIYQARPMVDPRGTTDACWADSPEATWHPGEVAEARAYSGHPA